MTVGTKERLDANYPELRHMLIHGASCNEMAKRFNCGAGTIYTYLESKGENVRKYKTCSSTALHDSKYIIDLHNQGYTATDIAKQLSYDTQVINSLLKKMSRRNKPGLHAKGYNYSINHTLFDVIDTEAKAYYLGLLAADGCVIQEEITIQLQDRDSYILEPLKDLVCKEKLLRRYKTKYGSYQTRLTWTSKSTVQKLIELGVTYKKSLTMKAIASYLPQHLIHHFIRGYFDGDGWISKGLYKNKKRVAIGMIGTKAFLDDVWKCIGIPVGTVREVKNTPNLYRLIYHGKGRMYELKSYLYNEATIFLSRKKEEFIW